MATFKVSRRCPWIISLRSYKNLEPCDTPIKRYARKSKKTGFFEKSTSKKRFESSKKLYFWRCFCFSDHSKKFSTHPMTMFKVSRRCPWIISSRWEKNQSHTTHQSKDMLGKSKKLGFLRKSTSKKRSESCKKNAFLKVILLFRSL